MLNLEVYDALACLQKEGGALQPAWFVAHPRRFSAKLFRQFTTKRKSR